MKNKKGQIFTLLAIALILLVFVTTNVYVSIKEKQVIRNRVGTMDSFLQSAETNLERQAYISGFRITFLAIRKISIDNNYLTDLDAFYEEAFFNGTVDGAYESLMEGVMYEDFAESLNSKGRKINVKITMDNASIRVFQDDPWVIKFELNTNFSMRDDQDLARWTRNYTVSGKVPVSGFLDPTYIVESYGQIPREVIRTPHEGNYVTGADYSNLADHFTNGYYSANSDAPSFLDRLGGNLGADPQGIETFVDPREFSKIGYDIYDKSLVDHVYFSTSTPSFSIVPEVYSDFKIDDGHKGDYQIP